MSIDLNDAEPQRGALIDPCFAKIVGVLRPGGIDGPAPADRGLLKASINARRKHRRGRKSAAAVEKTPLAHDLRRNRGRGTAVADRCNN
ncbi:hypothetical protein WCLP8_5090002 [uncultured Gammaproteobacteria bacterium]